MLLIFLVLFAITFGAGLLVFFLPNIKTKNFSNLLSFSGAYLFSITVIHILPELFKESTNTILTGIFVLIGFYFQILLDYFSQGVEHGHIHTHGNGSGHNNKATTLLFVSIMLHSFLEGSLLVHPHAHHGEAEVHNLTFGLILHKIPEAFALTAILIFQLRQRGLIIILLIIFSISSPLGLLVSDIIANDQLINGEWFTYLFAIVAGNFLHISTTIFFESETSGHRFKPNKVMVTTLGAFIAVMAEYFL